MEIKNYIEIKKNGEQWLIVFPTAWDRARFNSNFGKRVKMAYYAETSVEIDRNVPHIAVQSIIGEFAILDGLDVVDHTK